MVPLFSPAVSGSAVVAGLTLMMMAVMARRQRRILWRQGVLPFRCLSVCFHCLFAACP